MEEKIYQLEQELEEMKDIVLLLCEKVEMLEDSANKAWSLYAKVKNNPIVKTMLK